MSSRGPRLVKIGMCETDPVSSVFSNMCRPKFFFEKSYLFHRYLRAAGVLHIWGSIWGQHNIVLSVSRDVKFPTCCSSIWKILCSIFYGKDGLCYVVRGSCFYYFVKENHSVTKKICKIQQWAFTLYSHTPGKKGLFRNFNAWTNEDAHENC